MTLSKYYYQLLLYTSAVLLLINSLYLFLSTLFILILY